MASGDGGTAQTTTLVRRLLQNQVCVLDSLVQGEIPSRSSSLALSTCHSPPLLPPPPGCCRRLYWLVRRHDDTLEARAAELAAGGGEMSHPDRDAHRLRLCLLSSTSTERRRSGSPPSCRLKCTRGDGVEAAVGTRLLLSDDAVNVWEFRLDPGQSCPFHRHLMRYFFTNLTDSLTQELDEAGEEVAGRPPRRQEAGQTFFVNATELGAHAVRNVGDGTFLQFVVEIK